MIECPVRKKEKRSTKVLNKKPFNYVNEPSLKFTIFPNTIQWVETGSVGHGEESPSTTIGTEVI